MLSEFKIEKFKDSKRVLAHSMMNDEIKGVFYLPPLNRKETSEISAGDTFLGILDEVTGIGALLVAIDHDFNGKFEYDLTVTGKVKASNDVLAESISLKNHIHTITALPIEGGTPPVPIGTGSGSTDSPV